mmetsp:Transcript_23937/g.45721  ORF Transcript_23937/g.45721 Transcript_23937/m.45721 type:complete len:202 (-) Transcript_23937:1004-1609(-)
MGGRLGGKGLVSKTMFNSHSLHGIHPRTIHDHHGNVKMKMRRNCILLQTCRIHRSCRHSRRQTCRPCHCSCWKMSCCRKTDCISIGRWNGCGNHRSQIRGVRRRVRRVHCHGHCGGHRVRCRVHHGGHRVHYIRRWMGRRGWMKKKTRSCCCILLRSCRIHQTCLPCFHCRICHPCCNSNRHRGHVQEQDPIHHTRRAYPS